MLSTVLEVPEIATDFAILRSREFARLDANGHAYLDHTGSALYPQSLLGEHMTALARGVFGNPHAENPASLVSTALIEDARHRVLAFFDADPAEYAVVFTSNATAALHLAGSAYPFSESSPLILTQDNHNSVNGIREFARRRGAHVNVLPLGADLRLDEPVAHLEAITSRTQGRGLFAYPAQSNFSGVRHPLSLVATAQALGLRVLLDAAAYVPMSRLSLREVPADFVAISFYKMFGYPTGVGALIARRDALAELERPWFSGGTVDYVSVQNEVHAFRDNEGAFEDGTANFLGIPAVPRGLDHLERLGLANIETHARGLAMECRALLMSMRHEHGDPLVKIYGPADDADRGATLAFNVLEPGGRAVAFPLVEKRAHATRVSIRGGCFCNPGASEAAFRFPAAQTRACLTLAESAGWSIAGFAKCMAGFPVGALRASFGAPSNSADVRRLLAVVSSFAK